MNILYHHRTQLSGVEKVHIHGIANALKLKGHTVDILGPVHEQTNSGENRFFSKISRKMPEILFELFEIIYNIIAYRKIICNDRSIKYDLIYERYAFFLFAGILWARKLKLPYFLEVNYTTYTPLFRKRSKLLLFLSRFIEKLIFKNATAIFVVSTFLKDQLVEIGIDKSKIILTPNAVNESMQLHKFDSAKAIKKELDLNNTTIIGFVGGFYPWHGVDMLLRAVKNIDGNYSELSLLLIGDGPMKKDLEALAKNLNLSMKIVFTGAIKHSELPEYINVMDICVMPNSNSYGSPMKIFEYMAMGKSVIAPQLGPLMDIITNWETGLLFPPGDVLELSNCLRTLISDKKKRSEIGVNAGECVKMKHLWKYRADSVLEAIALKRRMF